MIIDNVIADSSYHSKDTRITNFVSGSRELK